MLRGISIWELYINSLYSGYLEGRPKPTDNDRHIESMIKSVTKKFPYVVKNRPPYVYMDNVKQGELLPPMGHFASLCNGDMMLDIIWFDESRVNPYESLDRVLNSFNWKEHAQEWMP